VYLLVKVMNYESLQRRYSATSASFRKVQGDWGASHPGEYKRVL
jgi:hypothetical protein